MLVPPVRRGGRKLPTRIEPEHPRRQNPRCEYGELISELVSFVSKTKELARYKWRGENAT